MAAPKTFLLGETMSKLTTADLIAVLAFEKFGVKQTFTTSRLWELAKDHMIISDAMRVNYPVCAIRSRIIKIEIFWVFPAFIRNMESLPMALSRDIVYFAVLFVYIFVQVYDCLFTKSSKKSTKSLIISN